MTRMISFLFLMLAIAFQAQAQQLLAVYDARLGPQDLVNSSGQPLKSFCAVVQQDRANFHRFGNRDPLDMGDPLFANKDNRARIAGACEIEPGFEYLRDFTFQGGGYGPVVRVRVLNDAGRLRVLVSERAG